MTNRRRMFQYTEKYLEDPWQNTGVCDCGHVLEPGEIVMGYPCDDFHIFVCLTCHFWNVLEESE